jgi:thioredoxin 1
MSSEIKEIRQRKMQELVKKMSEPKSGNNGFPEAPVHVTDANFEDFTRKYPVVVIDCWAPWCGPCRMLSPTIDVLSKEYKGKVAFGKLNTDENFATASKFRIASIPTLLYFKDGKLVDKSVGALPRSMLESQIKKVTG